jgi:hypothetical protein
MTNDSPRRPARRDPTDRRKPVARYVEFGREDIQARFIRAAENAYLRLASSDEFERLGEVEVAAAPAPPSRRGLFRRTPPPALPTRVVSTTAALARVAQATSTIPDEVQSSPNACAAARGVARILATVARELVDDLVVLDPAEQAAHPAYRQTLRLGAELEGFRDIVSQVGCTDSSGCVGIRSPEKWGRRAEDVEVSEVKAVLLRLAVRGGQGREKD